MKTTCMLRKYLLLKKKIIILILIRRRNERNAKKRMWVRKIFADRSQHGLFDSLVRELRLHDHYYFFKSFRMYPTTFELLLSWVGPLITKSSLRRPVASPSERLAVILRYLVTGDAHLTISLGYRISPATVGRIIRETSQVIWNVLLEKGCLHVPDTKEEWINIASEFESQWNFPHCVGALDGKTRYNTSSS